MKAVALLMVRDGLSDFPRYDLPPGFRFRSFRNGDEKVWARIETSAGEFASEDLGIDNFRREFEGHRHDLHERCVFMLTGRGEAIGTAMAWYGSLLPEGPAGRLHWVGIRREYQGRGLGKPLVSRALQLLSSFHDRVYLSTQTSSIVAVKIYLDFGFKPYITDSAQEVGWSMIAERLGLTVLDMIYSPLSRGGRGTRKR